MLESTAVARRLGILDLTRRFVRTDLDRRSDLFPQHTTVLAKIISTGPFWLSEGQPHKRGELLFGYLNTKRRVIAHESIFVPFSAQAPTSLAATA